MALVDNEPLEAHCLLALRRIEEIDVDVTFRGIQTSGFGRWLPYDFEKGNVGQLDEYVVKRLELSVYPPVQPEFRHGSPYVAWKENHPRVTLNS